MNTLNRRTGPLPLGVWTSRRIVARYTIEHDEPDRLVLRGSRVGVLLGAAILFASGVGPAVLGTGLIHTKGMPLALRLFALGLASLLLYGSAAMTINWIRVKDRILVDPAAGRITFEGPLALSPVELSQVERLELRQGVLSGVRTFKVVMRCQGDREIVVDSSSDRGRMEHLAERMAAVTGVPLSGGRHDRPSRPG